MLLVSSPLRLAWPHTIEGLPSMMSLALLAELLGPLVKLNEVIGADRRLVVLHAPPHVILEKGTKAEMGIERRGVSSTAVWGRKVLGK